MKKILLSGSLMLLFASVSFGQQVTTIDLDNFWSAYDSLPNCANKSDSVNVFQVYYIDKASDGFKAFLAARSFTAEEYYLNVKAYPRFWESIRGNTMRVKTLKSEIDGIYAAYESAFPGHEAPKICFAIGCLRTGGTVDDGYLLIGTEIAAADASTDKSELDSWLNSVMTEEFDIQNMIAHEYVHALQELKFSGVWGYLNYRVLMLSIYEGAADFIAERVTGATINEHIYDFGNAHEQEIWNDFKQDMRSNRADDWLYQGDNAKEGVPADLGYFVGYKICESYFNAAENKSEALQDIVYIKNFKRFYRKSGYPDKE